MSIWDTSLVEAAGSSGAEEGAQIICANNKVINDNKQYNEIILMLVLFSAHGSNIHKGAQVIGEVFGKNRTLSLTIFLCSLIHILIYFF